MIASAYLDKSGFMEKFNRNLDLDQENLTDLDLVI